LDGTQTSEPTEAEPGSSPGSASAFRRALDEQAVSEGPLDLTVPLNIAEIRAALSNSGPIPVVRAAGGSGGPGAPEAGSAGAAHHHHARRASRHTGSKRLGRIAVFVTLAAAMSVGTACALVMSSGSQNASSVSLPPTTGNIPVVASEDSSQQGQLSAVPSAAPSATALTPSASPSSPSASASPSGSPSATASASVSSAAASAGTGTTFGPRTPSASASATQPSAAPTNSTSSNWVTLYRGVDNESQETSQVQSLLADLGFLDSWHHHSYINPDVGALDQSGDYGTATDDAVAEFQAQFHVDYSGQAGSCDLSTYDALVQAAG
jgi:hypothetical protein